MKTANPVRIMIAGTGSGCGKTTVTCAVLGALKASGLRAASFKSGPDYIDPMFHSEIIGTKSRNLDLFLMGENAVLHSLAENSAQNDISVIEGVMGFYDGAGLTGEYSSCHLSNVTKTPVILVAGCKGMSLTICALLKGMAEFMENRIAGVILNGVSSEKMYGMYRSMIEQNTPLKVYGYLPNMPEAALKSRHLGLVTAAEVDTLKDTVSTLSQQAKASIDLEGLVLEAQKVEHFEYRPLTVKARENVRLAVARDRAFCFYYEDSLQLLVRMGAELVPFSPLQDAQLPRDIDGAVFGGGYPELYVKELSENTPMRMSVQKAVQGGMPMLGECGGFMYLQDGFTGKDGTMYPLAGCIPSRTAMTEKLCRFGYVELTAQEDTLLCKKGWKINAHEFHYADSTDCGNSFTARKVSGGTCYPCIVSAGNLLAGYPHMHFYGNPLFAERLIDACVQYRRERLCSCL